MTTQAPTPRRREAANRYVQPRQFSATEGVWIAAVKQFCIPFRFPKFAGPKGPLPDAAVVEAGLWHVATANLRFLLHDCGGHRSVPVVRGRSRPRGTLLDAELNRGFSLRYSNATRDAWLGLARGLSALASEATGVRYAKKVARESIIVDDTLPGDWMFYWMLASGLATAPIYDEDVAVLRRRLYLGSPLAALADLQMSTTVQRERLLQPDSVRLIELFGPILPTTWRAQFEWLWNYRGQAKPFVDRATQIAAVAEQWFDLLQKNQRADLGIVIGLWLLEIGELCRGRGTDVRAALTSKIELRSIKDRDATLVPLVQLFSLGARLVEQRQQFAQTGYGNARYDEAQVFLARFDAEIGDRADALTQLLVDVRGAIG